LWNCTFIPYSIKVCVCVFYAVECVQALQLHIEGLAEPLLHVNIVT